MSHKPIDATSVPTRQSGFDEIWECALTFNGYEELKDCAELANR